MIRFVMSGARGRMGQMILNTATLPDFKDRITASGQIDVGDDPVSQIQGASVMIDFSSPANTLAMAKLCMAHNVGFIVGTTGLTSAQETEIESASSKIPVLISPNMSLGVNLLFHLTGIAVSAVPQADVEIVELHHNQKVDAPSGTAARMKDIVKEKRNLAEKDVVHGREGLVGKRKQEEIGMHAVRGGDTPGDHTVYLFLDGERLEITHRTLSRIVFARGALQAALFLSGKPAGIYTMNDVLGIANA